MRTIPLPLRKQLSDDPRMAACAICKTTVGLQWHHPLLYNSRQINEPYSIIPVCEPCHKGKDGAIPQKNREICELQAIVMGLQSDLETKYPRVNWRQRRDWLTRKLVLEK